MIRNNEMKLRPEPIRFRFVAPAAVALVALTQCHGTCHGGRFAPHIVLAVVRR
jgi:hypothetical protein